MRKSIIALMTALSTLVAANFLLVIVASIGVISVIVFLIRLTGPLT